LIYHPVCANKEGGRFLYGAATPPIRRGTLLTGTLSLELLGQARKPGNDWLSVWLLLVAIEAQCADAFVEIGAFNAQNAGGSGNVPAGFVEGLQDLFALSGIARLLQG